MEDEIPGRLANCEPVSPVSPIGCCSQLILTNKEKNIYITCQRVETGYYNNHDYYHCIGNDYVYFWNNQFRYASGGDPTINGVMSGIGQHISQVVHFLDSVILFVPVF